MKNPRQLLIIVLAIAMLASLAACGNKGALVHPDKEKSTPQEPAASSN